MKKRLIFGILLLLAALLAAPGVLAAEVEETEAPAEPVRIHTAEDLLAIAEDPSGSYILMEDLDMTDVQWLPLDFSGTLDGNGHAILNLTVDQPGQTTEKSYDGNKKVYDTAYAGMFCTLRGAVITNLQLINIRALVESETPCFLAGIAGYMEDSTVSGCTVSGTLELRAFDRMFGIGGIAGYGSGKIENCQVDVTLICTDTDAATKDEQFMGGVYGTGCIDVIDCQVNINGYCSEYGYVHNGGIVGMFMQYPFSTGRTGYITGNHVTGQITFFEKNNDRRAYCKAYVGETLANGCKIEENTNEFTRNEVWKYDTELRPEMCEAPTYTETVTYPGCSTYGYTSYCCDGCGYTYTDHYTLFRHDPGEWTVVVEATELAEGLIVACCTGCDMEFERILEKLEPAPTEPPTEVPTEPETAPTEAAPVQTVSQAPEEIPQWLLALVVVEIGAIVIVVMLLLAGKNKKRKHKKGKFAR